MNRKFIVLGRQDMSRLTRRKLLLGGASTLISMPYILKNTKAYAKKTGYKNWTC